jgi:hypothetical protein
MMACLAGVRKRAFLSQRHDVSHAKKLAKFKRRESATVVGVVRRDGGEWTVEAE